MPDFKNIGRKRALRKFWRAMKALGFKAIPKRMIIGYACSWYMYTAKYDFCGKECFGISWQECSGSMDYQCLKDELGHVTDQAALEQAVQLCVGIIDRLGIKPKKEE